MTTDDYPMTIRWLSDYYPMTIQWLSRTFDLFFLMNIDLKRSIDRRWFFKSGATFILRWSSTTCPPLHISTRPIYDPLSSPPIPQVVLKWPSSLMWSNYCFTILCDRGSTHYSCDVLLTRQPPLISWLGWVFPVAAWQVAAMVGPGGPSVTMDISTQ